MAIKLFKNDTVQRTRYDNDDGHGDAADEQQKVDGPVALLKVVVRATNGHGYICVSVWRHEAVVAADDARRGGQDERCEGHEQTEVARGARLDLPVVRTAHLPVAVEGNEQQHRVAVNDGVAKNVGGHTAQPRGWEVEPVVHFRHLGRQHQSTLSEPDQPQHEQEVLEVAKLVLDTVDVNDKQVGHEADTCRQPKHDAHTQNLPTIVGVKLFPQPRVLPAVGRIVQHKWLLYPTIRCCEPSFHDVWISIF